MITKKANFLKVLQNIYFNKSEPVSIVHFLTNRCNARCSFCFIDFDHPEAFSKELSLGEINTLTKNMGNSLLNVNFTGGEPFARKDIIEIAKAYISNTTIESIYVTTNGSLPDRVLNYAKQINNFNPDIEQNFQISIDDMPKEHDRVRKIKGLFDSCIQTYKSLNELNISNINPIISITVNHENYKSIKNIFNYLVNDCGIKSLKCTIVRDEGVYKTPIDKKQKIYEAYKWLTSKIENLLDEKKLVNYNDKSIQGRVHLKKDKISWDIIKKTYLSPKYISPCHASSLFGIITSKGSVYPCEVLEHKKIGNLRDNNMNFIKLWESKKNKELKKFILKTKCNCSYECALSFNILGNYRYQPTLISSAFDIF